MLRLLFIRPSSSDADIRAHAHAIGRLPQVELQEREAPEEDRLAFVLRSAAELFRWRDETDAIVTVGTAALEAARYGWRGPHVHIPVGRLTRDEVRRCRGLSRRPQFRIITSSAAIARQALRHFAVPHQVSVIRPTAATEARFTRDEIRQRLGVTDDQPLVYVPGIARPGSNHRLGLWASNILYFRDHGVRVLIVPGGPREGFVNRFLTSAELWPAVVMDATLNEAERAMAADVAIVAADGAPDVVPLATLTAAGTPIAGLLSTWSREQLSAYPATLAAEPKARLLARATLEALEGGRRTPPAAGLERLAEDGWAALLNEFVGHRAPARV